MKKFIACFTLICFVFSSVLVPGIRALADTAADVARTARAFDEFVLPHTAGRVTEGAYFGGGTVVINIQDLHCHPEAQKNIARILSLVDDKYPLSRVYVEGAIGAVDTSWLSKIRDRKTRENIAGSLLRHGRLTGSEYYSVTSQKPRLLVGIEDEKVYLDNLARINDILARRGKTQDLLQRIKTRSEGLKEKYFTPSHRKLDRLVGRNLQGDIEALTYYRIIDRYAKELRIGQREYPDFAAFIRLSRLQKDLDYRRASEQIARVMRKLKQRLPYTAYRRLLETAENGDRNDELSLILMKTCKEENIPVAALYPQLARFFEYLRASQEINPQRLISEEKDLIRRLHWRLSSSEGEREVTFLVDFIGYLEAYLNNKISADDYAYYLANREKFRLLWEKYTGSDLITALSPFTGQIDAFYAANLERNRCFIRSIFGAVPAQNRSFLVPRAEENIAKVISSLKDAKDIVVVITGGFHTSGLTDLLKDKKVSYLVVSPSVTQDTAFADETYVKLIKEEAEILTQTYPALMRSSLLHIIEGLEHDEIRTALLPVAESVLADHPDADPHEIAAKTENELQALTGTLPGLRAVRLVYERSGHDTHYFLLRYNKEPPVRLAYRGGTVERLGSFRPGNAGLVFRPEDRGRILRSFFRDVLSLVINGIHRIARRTIAKAESLRIRQDSVYYSEKSVRNDRPFSIETAKQCSDFGRQLVAAGLAGEGRPIAVREHTFSVVIERGMGLSDAEIGELIKEALDRFRDDARKKLPSTLVVAFLDRSSHLFEDHGANGFIGVNRIIDQISDPEHRKIMLKLGLAHELAHEVTGRGKEEIFERGQFERDIEAAATLLRKTGVSWTELSRGLSNVLATGEFIESLHAQMKKTAVGDVEAFLKIPREKNIEEIDWSDTPAFPGIERFFPADSRFLGMAQSPDGWQLAVARVTRESGKYRHYIDVVPLIEKADAWRWSGVRSLCLDNRRFGDGVGAVAFSEDGTSVVWTNLDGEIGEWDLASGRQKIWGWGLKRTASGRPRGPNEWELYEKTGRAVKVSSRKDVPAVTAVHLSSNGRYLTLVDNEEVVRVADVAEKTVRFGETDAGGLMVKSSCISPDGHFLALWSGEGKIRIKYTEQLEDYPPVIREMLKSRPDLRPFLYQDMAEIDMMQYVDHENPLHPLNAFGPLDYSPDGKYLFVTTHHRDRDHKEGSIVRVFDFATREVIAEHRFNDFVTSLSMLDFHDRIAMSHLKDGQGTVSFATVHYQYKSRYNEIVKAASLPLRKDIVDDDGQLFYSERSMRGGEEIRIRGEEDLVTFYDQYLHGNATKRYVREHSFVIENGIEITDDELAELIGQALLIPGGDIDNIPHTVVIAFLDASSHLIEDHLANGFIGINRCLLKIRKEKPVMGKVLLKVGLSHEFSHEVVRAHSDSFEKEQLDRDARFAVALLAKRGESIMFSALRKEGSESNYRERVQRNFSDFDVSLGEYLGEEAREGYDSYDNYVRAYSRARLPKLLQLVDAQKLPEVMVASELNLELSLMNSALNGRLGKVNCEYTQADSGRHIYTVWRNGTHSRFLYDGDKQMRVLPTTPLAQAVGRTVFHDIAELENLKHDFGNDFTPVAGYFQMWTRPERRAIPETEIYDEVNNYIEFLLELRFLADRTPSGLGDEAVALIGNFINAANEYEEKYGYYGSDRMRDIHGLLLAKAQDDEAAGVRGITGSLVEMIFESKIPFVDAVLINSFADKREKSEEVNVYEIVLRVLKHEQRLYSAEKEPLWELTGDRDITLTINWRALQRSVKNILKNAGEAIAMNSGGKCRVNLSRRDGRIRIEIADTAGGIAPEVLLRIFNRGVSTKGQGRGLGLDITRQKLEAECGARIVVMTRPGEENEVYVLSFNGNGAAEVRSANSIAPEEKAVLSLKEEEIRARSTASGTTFVITFPQSPRGKVQEAGPGADSDDRLALSGVPGSWFENRSYLRTFAWWVESLVSLISGAAIGASLPLLLGIQSSLTQAIFSGIAAGLTFWVPHARLGKAVVFSRNIMSVTALTVVSGMIVSSFGAAPVAALLTAAALVLVHRNANLTAGAPPAEGRGGMTSQSPREVASLKESPTSDGKSSAAGAFKEYRRTETGLWSEEARKKAVEAACYVARAAYLLPGLRLHGVINRTLSLIFPIFGMAPALYGKEYFISVTDFDPAVERHAREIAESGLDVIAIAPMPKETAVDLVNLMDKGCARAEIDGEILDLWAGRIKTRKGSLLVVFYKPAAPNIPVRPEMNTAVIRSLYENGHTRRIIKRELGIGYNGFSIDILETDSVPGNHNLMKETSSQMSARGKTVYVYYQRHKVEKNGGLKRLGIDGRYAAVNGNGVVNWQKRTRQIFDVIIEEKTGTRDALRTVEAALKLRQADSFSRTTPVVSERLNLSRLLDPGGRKLLCGELTAHILERSERGVDTFVLPSAEKMRSAGEDGIVLDETEAKEALGHVEQAGSRLLFEYAIERTEELKTAGEYIGHLMDLGFHGVRIDLSAFVGTDEEFMVLADWIEEMQKSLSGISRFGGANKEIIFAVIAPERADRREAIRELGEERDVKEVIKLVPGMTISGITNNSWVEACLEERWYDSGSGSVRSRNYRLSFDAPGTWEDFQKKLDLLFDSPAGIIGFDSDLLENLDETTGSREYDVPGYIRLLIQKRIRALQVDGTPAERFERARLIALRLSPDDVPHAIEDLHETCTQLLSIYRTFDPGTSISAEQEKAMQDSLVKMRETAAGSGNNREWLPSRLYLERITGLLEESNPREKTRYYSELAGYCRGLLERAMLNEYAKGHYVVTTKGYRQLLGWLLVESDLLLSGYASAHERSFDRVSSFYNALFDSFAPGQRIDIEQVRKLERPAIAQRIDRLWSMVRGSTRPAPLAIAELLLILDICERELKVSPQDVRKDMRILVPGLSRAITGAA